jgi:hypothetical protein
MDSRLQELLDKQEIHDRLMLYFRGVDRGDADSISQAFHRDAVSEHGHVSFTGETVGRDLERMCLEGANPSGVHFTGNELIEVDGDEAFSEVYFFAFREEDRDGQTVLYTRCGRLIDRWERRGDAWGIVHRRVVDSWNRADPVLERLPWADHFLRSEIGSRDAVYDVRTAGKGQ